MDRQMRRHEIIVEWSSDFDRGRNIDWGWRPGDMHSGGWAAKQGTLGAS